MKILWNSIIWFFILTIGGNLLIRLVATKFGLVDYELMQYLYSFIMAVASLPFVEPINKEKENDGS